MVAKSSGSTFLFFLQVHFDCFGLPRSNSDQFYSLQFHQKSTSFKGTLARIELNFSASDTNSSCARMIQYVGVIICCDCGYIGTSWAPSAESQYQINTHSVLLLVEIIAILSSFWIPFWRCPGNSIGGNKFFR
jgi:hypothetical protein